MSASLITAAAAAAVQLAIRGARAEATETIVPSVIPRLMPDAITAYCYHDGSTDYVKAVGGPVERTHHIPIHLLILSGADDTNAEAILLDLHDAICNAFYTQHTLGGLCQRAELHQRDGAQQGGGQYTIDAGQELRHRWFSLTAVERLSFTFA